MNNRNHCSNKPIHVKNTLDIKEIIGVSKSEKPKLMDAFIEIPEKEENANLIRMKHHTKDSKELYSEK